MMRYDRLPAAILAARRVTQQGRRGVSIGEALTGARDQAGLTVAQVSQETRIRQTIIKCIEGDDFAVCGGDFYARGHIRSIARAVGTDPAPLIEEYDAAHRALEPIPAADAFEPVRPAAAPAWRGWAASWRGWWHSV
jgi:hypothetical protein